MRVLMISTDKGLVGGRILGDVIERHKQYGDLVDKLDIIVQSKPGFKSLELSEKAQTHPTNSRFWVFSYVRDAVKIGRRLFQNQPHDLIVTQDPFRTGKAGLRLKKEFGVKLLVHFHGDFKSFPQAVIDGADAIRVMSQGQKVKLVAKGISNEKIRVISTPVDLDRFDNFEQRATHDQKKMRDNLKKQFSGKTVIAMIGRDDKVKGDEVFKEAIRIVKDKKGADSVEAWRIGSTNSDTKVIDLVTGGIDGKDLPVYYQVLDILVSSSFSESFGKVLVEANASGKPVVATETTGAREIVQNGINGFLVPIGDAQALAEKILYLIDHPQEAEQVGKNGRNLVLEKYGDNIKKVISYWREITGS